MKNRNQDLVNVEECTKCGKTFDAIKPEVSEPQRMQQLLPLGKDTLRNMVIDLQNAVTQGELLERQYSKSLGRLAQLCDIVLPWLGKASKDDAEWPQEVRAGYNEIMNYVDAVRPLKSGLGA